IYGVPLSEPVLGIQEMKYNEGLNGPEDVKDSKDWWKSLHGVSLPFLVNQDAQILKQKRKFCQKIPNVC
ncbi:hypothetical protein NPIL_522191, partial [Nephila pilipes]